MKRTNNPDRGKIIDIILRNDVRAKETPEIQMYLVGDCEAAITVQCDEKGTAKTAFCMYDHQVIKFDNPEDALFVSNACKQRIIGQTREQIKVKKINSFNRKFR